MNMMIKSTSVKLIVTLAIVLAATLTWIKNYKHNTDRAFDKTEPNGQQRKLLDLSCWMIFKPTGCKTPAPTKAPSPKPITVLDLSCWKQNKPPGCNATPPPSRAPTNQSKPTLRPTTSQSPPSGQPPSPQSSPDNFFWQALRITGWESEGYCTNAIAQVPGVPVFGTREECCQEFAGSSSPENEIYTKCMDFDPVPIDYCDGLNRDTCKGNPICDYNQYRDECLMMCEGRDANHCQAQVECEYVPIKYFCTMTEDQYRLARCGRIDSVTECGEVRGCVWDYYASNKQGQCQSRCGREKNSNTCEEAGDECYWDKQNKKCYFDISKADAPTPMPALPRFCPNIRKKDNCNANRPRCKWNNNNNKCIYLCESTTKKPNCNDKYCEWDNKDDACWPRYEDYCDDLGEVTCGETLQCEWKGVKEGCATRCTANKQEECDNNDKTPCFWDPVIDVCRYDPDLDTEKKAFMRPLSDRFVKGHLFDR